MKYSKVFYSAAFVLWSGLPLFSVSSSVSASDYEEVYVYGQRPSSPDYDWSDLYQSEVNATPPIRYGSTMNHEAYMAQKKAMVEAEESCKEQVEDVFEERCNDAAAHIFLSNSKACRNLENRGSQNGVMGTGMLALAGIGFSAASGGVGGAVLILYGITGIGVGMRGAGQYVSGQHCMQDLEWAYERNTERVCPDFAEKKAEENCGSISPE